MKHIILALLIATVNIEELIVNDMAEFISIICKEAQTKQCQELVLAQIFKQENEEKQETVKSEVSK